MLPATPRRTRRGKRSRPCSLRAPLDLPLNSLQSPDSVGVQGSATNIMCIAHGSRPVQALECRALEERSDFAAELILEWQQSRSRYGFTSNAHPHPSLGLYNQSGTLLTSSNQCVGSNADSAAVLAYYQNGGAPLNANDACLGYVTSLLPAGVYTFVITPDPSNPSASGEVLFETIPLH